MNSIRTSHRDHRLISYVEQYFFWRTQLKHYSNYRILVEHKNEITPGNLYHALAIMVYKYSALTMDVVISDNKLGHSFVFADKVKFGDVVEFIDDEKYDGIDAPLLILDEYQSEVFIYGTNKPLWRCKVINKKYLLFYCDHLLFDGTSGKNFHSEVEKEMSNLELKETIRPITKDSLLFDLSMTDPEEYQLIPSPTNLIDYNSSWRYIIYKVCVELLPAKISNLIKYYFGRNPYRKNLCYQSLDFKSIKSSMENINKCVSISLGSTDLETLITKCRTKNAKLTSLLIVLAHDSSRKILNRLGERYKYKDTSTSVPINIRRFINLEKGKKLSTNYSTLFGLYMGHLEIDLPAIAKFEKLDWNLVKYLNDYIHDNIDESPLDLGLLRFVNPKAFIVEHYKQERKYTLEVSNLGQFTFENSNIINAWFDQPSQIFSVNLISTQSSTNLVLRTANTEWVSEYASEFCNGLQNVLGKEKHSIKTLGL